MSVFLKKMMSVVAISAAALSVAFISRTQATKTGASGEEEPLAEGMERVVLAGGCFWGVEAVFEHTKGVVSAVSGYAGGRQETASYMRITRGDTGHAEAVQVTYDPKQVSFSELLEVYFTVAHNPTQLNYQGPDHGTQYRSAIFYANDAQKQLSEEKIQQISQRGLYDAPVVTSMEPLDEFYTAESYHQNFAQEHPLHPYILMHDAPKVERLKQSFPKLYRDQ